MPKRARADGKGQQGKRRNKDDESVDETTRGQGGYLPGRAGNEGSAPSMDQGAGTDGQAAAQPAIGQAEAAAVETAAGAGSQEAPDRAGSGPRQESKIVRELKDQRKKKREAQAAAAYWKGVADGRMGAQTVAPPGARPQAGAASARPDGLREPGRLRGRALRIPGRRGGRRAGRKHSARPRRDGAARCIPTAVRSAR